MPQLPDPVPVSRALLSNVCQMMTHAIQGGAYNRMTIAEQHAVLSTVLTIEDEMARHREDPTTPLAHKITDLMNDRTNLESQIIRLGHTPCTKHGVAKHEPV